MKKTSTYVSMFSISKIYNSLGLLFVSLFFSAQLAAQAPQGFNYQAVVRNSGGSIVPNQHVGVQFTIHNDSLSGNIAFRESDTIVTNPEGIFTVVIGAGNITAGSIGDVHWATGKTFLQVGIDVAGGNNYVDMGTSQLVSVPYSLYSASAGSASTVNLKEDSITPVTGNFNLSVGSTGYLSIAAGVTPPNALVNSIMPGYFPGQLVVFKGSSTAGSGKGVRFQPTTTNLNIGTSGGSLDLFGGSTMMLMWDGNTWLLVSYSKNQ